ncbi:hypothetical protein OIDMADRAFT_104709 [Oidiodendron maius Zn]|uniref:Uncharacterized protein n=1 Tax=Oidiodendron maius (strain Zn) TaxID=913774 RepID=A0A0C3CLQ0_OIDMZ|nr:hypothetical protein OIDMADRAFT_104709 [Oidiodendron maius Zn]
MATTLLKGTAFLTGAASGIGRAAALGLAKYGIKRLALADINRSNLLATSETIKAQYANIEIEAIELDVRDAEAVESSVLQAVKRFGSIDIGVNVAGIEGSGKRTDECEDVDWTKVMDVNLNGVWRCQKAQVRAMMKQKDLGPRRGRGNIINVASMYGLIGTPSEIPASAYVASKHGVVGLTKSDATVYASHGIRINAICPGYVKTPLLQALAANGAMNSEIAKTPMKRMADVEEIADCIVFLASPMASFMTGSSLLADGGYTIN